MVYTKLSTFVKAIRLRYAAPFVLLLVVVYVMVINPWVMNRGSSETERQMILPGDELYPDRTGLVTQAITINTPPNVVWQWLIQIGQDRACFYTYTWLENLLGADFHNADEIHPEWQNLAVGDGWRLLPSDYLGSVGKDAVVPLLINQPGYALVFEMFGAYVIEPIDENTSRLLVRGYSGSTNLMTVMVLDPVVKTMERRMLLGLKARAEGRPDAPPILMIIAYLGWSTAGISVAYLYLSQRRRRYWLVLPILAALPALLISSDLQAGLAAFLAVGITLLGFLIFGRNWWGSIFVIASVVLLTLLLAPEAYIAFGFAFLLVLLAVLGVVVAGHSRNRLLGG